MLDVAAAVIRDNLGRYLLCRRPPGAAQAGLWEFPGGKLESGETPAAALKRECFEELGATVELGPQLMAAEHAYPGRAIRLVFLAARVISGPLEALVHSEIRWVPPEGLLDLDLSPADRGMAARLATESVPWPWLADGGR